jgi:hypothetical protein
LVRKKLSAILVGLGDIYKIASWLVSGKLLRYLIIQSRYMQ